ncbi:MAG: hypothetical protein ACKO96_25265 [Flammeovirgaceae bacterium]
MINQSFTNANVAQATVYVRNFSVALANLKLVLEEEKKRKQK